MPIEITNKKGSQHDMAVFLRNEFRQKYLDGNPKAILIISAHWESRGHRVNTASETKGIHETIHDFGGFPRELFEMTYDAPGSPDVASRVIELAAESGIKVTATGNRGLDHGAWSPLSTIWPEADIPIVQLSLDKDFDGPDHVKLGKALAPLRDEGVMIIGSGGATHNLRLIMVPDEFLNKEDRQANIDFDDWLKDVLVNKSGEARNKELIGFKESNPHWKAVHPRLEHWAPVYVAAGAAGEAEAECFYDKRTTPIFSLASYIWK